MLYEKLRQLEQLCLQNPNYQYRNLSQDERMKLAALSFKRVPESDRNQIVASWTKYCESNKIACDMKDCVWYRFLCQTNLFFLCHILEKYNQVTVKTHEDICNDFFVSKDPANFTAFETFAKAYTSLKDRLLLVPRGGFKSSIDIADVVQWIICFPEVTILILTGVYDLAKDFVKETTEHFTLSETGEIKDKKPVFGPKYGTDGISPNVFQVLFPEHCIEPNDVKQTEFQTPASRLRDKEPTVMAASIEQNLSGWHFGIMKLDDVVTNENSLTAPRMQAINKQVSVNRAMLHPFGFFDKIGTWYDESDTYGIDIRNEERFAKEENVPGSVKGSPFEGVFNSEVTMKIYLRAAWWPTEEAKKSGKIEEEMKEDDWVLWFPERLPYKFLAREKKRDAEGFAIKYENNPRKVHQIKFPRELLLRRTIPATQLPHQGMIVSAVDTAYSIKSWADYTVMVTALIFGGRFYIIDMVRGRFNEYELPRVIAATGNKWKPKRIAIEESVGVKWLGREIRREMDALSISIPIEFVSLGVGTKTKSKELKAKPVARLLGDERMLFANTCGNLEDLYKELERFGTAEATHDDVVDGLAILADQFGGYADMEAKVNFAQTQYTADRLANERHQMIYGLGRFSKFNAAFAMDDNPVTAFQLENGKQEALTDVDPFADIF